MSLFTKKSASAVAPEASGGNGLPWQQDEPYMRTCEKYNTARGMVALLQVALQEAEAKELELTLDYETKKPQADAELIADSDLATLEQACQRAKSTTENLRQQLKKAQERLPELQRAKELAAAEAQKRAFPESARCVIEKCNSVEAAVQALKTAQEELARAVKQHRTLGDLGTLASTFSGYVVHPAHFEKVYAQGMVAIGIDELRKVVSRLEKKLGAQG